MKLRVIDFLKIGEKANMWNKIKRKWNNYSKFKKYCIITAIWIINLFFYIKIPKNMELLEIFHLMIAGCCGSLWYIIYQEYI